ncbi:MAG: hypothetical protein CMG26_03585 [Candidatus Marinimicrobia bacterium]|nr:hypothetical protein [Candidatus Neomarinimicrobiota bacterium]|tara:strand:+ start:369 stop:764 length:396 start_codon:yes stop_codon:yes gene_type:complete
MKMVKNIAIVACAASFMFANVSFHMSNNYSSLDANPIVVNTSYGASYALNGTTTVGYDSTLGMLMSFGVGNTSLRMGWSTANNTTTTSLGLGFTWWNGGDGFNTSISTNYDLRGTGDTSDGNLSMVVGFGF